MNRTESKFEFDTQIAKAIMAGLKTYTEIGQEFGVSHVYVIKVGKKFQVLRKVTGKGSPAWKNKLLKVV